MNPEADQPRTDLIDIQSRLAKIIAEPTDDDDDPYKNREAIKSAQDFFTAMGISLEDNGLISPNLSSDQVTALAQWRNETMNGSIEMPDQDTFYRKVLLAISLWPQVHDGQIAYLMGKGIGAEISIRGVVKGRTKRPEKISFRSHSDFELYGVEYERNEIGSNISGTSVYPHNFKEVFGAQEVYPPTKTKGMQKLPPMLMYDTAETVDLGGVTILVPQLELQFLDKWEAPEGYHRPEGSDAEVLAYLYDLDREKVHEYIDRYVIEPGAEALDHLPSLQPQWHFDRVRQLIRTTRIDLIADGSDEPTLEEVLARVNADIQAHREIYPDGNRRIGGVSLKLWRDLTPEHVDADDQVIDDGILREVAEQLDQDKSEQVKRLHRRHARLDEFFQKVDIKRALVDRHLSTSIDTLPPVQEGNVRWVHTTHPNNILAILEAGLDYEKYGMIDSTARPVSPDDPESYYTTDIRFNTPGVQTIVFDIPTSELRLHRDMTKSPGVLPATYIVGVIEGYKPIV